jgi:hypothetical protein
MHNNLPNHNYSKYNGSSGLATSQWGPHAWIFLFSSIHGAYPIKINNKNKEHLDIKKHFKQLFTNLQFTMPCIFCRNSYKTFFKELPIDKFLIGRIELMYWLYLLRDKVNKKLIQQEKECYNNEKKLLKKKYHENKITKDEYYSKISEFKNKTFQTKQSPPFIEVLERFESMRATCSPKSKTCALPEKK